MRFKHPLRAAAVLAAVLTCATYGLGFLAERFGGHVAFLAFAALLLTPAGLTASAALGLRPPMKLDDFSNQGVNQKATLAVTRGSAYHDILIECYTNGVAMTVAQMKSMIDTIVVKLNGKPIQEWTPTTLDIVNSTYGAQYAMTNGFMRLYFSEPYNRSWEGEERGAWGTDGIDSFTIELKTNNTAVVPTFVAWGTTDESNRSIRSWPIRHVRNSGALAVVAGTSQVPNPLREVGMFYRRLHFLSALISKVKIQTQKVTKWDDLPRAVVAELLAKRGFALQANVYTVAFDMTSAQLTDQLATFIATNPPVLVPDLRIEYTGTGAGTVEIVSEQYQLFN